jgi:hypothetical protein
VRGSTFDLLPSSTTNDIMHLSPQLIIFALFCDIVIGDEVSANCALERGLLNYVMRLLRVLSPFPVNFASLSFWENYTSD